MAEETPHDPDRCPPCRGTGRVTSNQGETRTELECPWCGGTGRRQPGRNAQDPEGERKPADDPDPGPPDVAA